MCSHAMTEVLERERPFPGKEIRESRKNLQALLMFRGGAGAAIRGAHRKAYVRRLSGVDTVGECRGCSHCKDRVRKGCVRHTPWGLPRCSCAGLLLWRVRMLKEWRRATG